ncbi:MAG: shikimate kinase [Microbacteriaceae bacterium]|nr:shikimate kinase [Microbacteriaceae bacterium]
MSERPLVVFVGPPAAGKSKLARLVAKSLGVGVVDTDSEVAKQWGSIPEIFEKHGETFFRQKEREAVVSALESPGIVSLGGGAVIDPDTRADLRGHRVALITISADAVAPRLNNTKRPLLKDGVDGWTQLVESRAHWYDEVATRVFDTSHAPMESLAQDITDWVREDARL